MDTRFLQAWVESKHRVLGYDLAPFCLNHLLALHAAESPFVLGGIPEFEDLLLFLKVCSNSARELAPADRQIKRELRKTPLELERAIVGALEYLASASHRPQFAEQAESDPEAPGEHSGGTGRLLTAPAALARIAFMHVHSNLSHTEIMTMKLDQLADLEAAIAEQKGGDVRFRNEEEDAWLTANAKAKGIWKEPNE